MGETSSRKSFSQSFFPLIKQYSILNSLGEENQELSLAQLRKHKYMKMVSTSKKGLQPERLPPTENAIKYHSFRVYLQIQQWLGVDIDETMWGWKKENDVLVPIKTDKVRLS